jgi:hypothetical protein
MSAVNLTVPKGSWDLICNPGQSVSISVAEVFIRICHLIAVKDTDICLHWGILANIFLTFQRSLTRAVLSDFYMH